MVQLVTLRASAPVEDVVSTLEGDGAVIVEAAASSELLAQLSGEMAPYLGSAIPGGGPAAAGALVCRSAAARALLLNETVTAVCDKALLRHCERYQLHSAMVVQLDPGQARQAVGPEPRAWGKWLDGIVPLIRAAWALDELAVDRGAPRVAVGSTKWHEERRATDQDVANAELKPGSVLLYVPTAHWGFGANLSDRLVRLANVAYAVGWLRQEENQYLTCPPDLARTLEPRLRGLIGYTMGQFALGYFTPPLKAGEGPELVGPEYALDPANSGRHHTFEALQAKVQAAARGETGTKAL